MIIILPWSPNHPILYHRVTPIHHPLISWKTGPPGGGARIGTAPMTPSDLIHPGEQATWACDDERLASLVGESSKFWYHCSGGGFCDMQRQRPGA